MKKYPDCQYEQGGNCAACSLSHYGMDCHNNPLPDAARLISTTQYAQLHGKDRSSVLRLLGRGGFTSATRIGRNWLISADEPYPDRRVTSGAYVGKQRRR